MPWETSRRRKDPPYWPKLRAEILTRANNMCEHTQVEQSPQGTRTVRCTYPAKDVDHIVNLANGGTDAPTNLQALCEWHHKRKTSQEATEARAKAPRLTERRPKPKHPGLID